jgi:hypothetical protein
MHRISLQLVVPVMHIWINVILFIVVERIYELTWKNYSP